MRSPKGQALLIALKGAATPSLTGRWLPVIGYQLSVIGYRSQYSVINAQRSSADQSVPGSTRLEHWIWSTVN